MLAIVIVSKLSELARCYAWHNGRVGRKTKVAKSISTLDTCFIWSTAICHPVTGFPEIVALTNRDEYPCERYAASVALGYLPDQ